MKTLALAAATILAGLATSVSAQTYYDRSYDPYRDGRSYYAERDARVLETRPQECFNPRAGHFEMVRPGEIQNDLDFRNCRFLGYREDERSARREWREAREECWNPRARHFEEVRRGEVQDDLDFGRCRMLRG